MYLYYLIGYNLVNNHMQSIKEEVNSDFKSCLDLVKELPHSLVQQVIISTISVQRYEKKE